MLFPTRPGCILNRSIQGCIRRFFQEWVVSNQRPDRPEYFMNIALAVRERADCLGQKVGAVIVLDHRIMATGYNGTPAGMRNCSEGGCVRCANRDKKYVSGTGYDLCICVHAEQNAILAAARFGISIQGATIYTTVQPCFGCLKEALQAGIEEVLYLHPWRSAKDADPEQQAQYEILASRLPKGLRQLVIDDPRAEWARGGSPAPAPSIDQHGMESQ